MINDLYELEELYGRAEGALYVDEMLVNYNEQVLTSALEQGLLETRTVCIGPNCGRILCWLTEKGRCKASATMH